MTWTAFVFYGTTMPVWSVIPGQLCYGGIVIHEYGTAGWYDSCAVWRARP